MFQKRVFKALSILILLAVLGTGQVAAAPGKAALPALIEPLDGELLIHLHPFFDWDEVPGIIYYTLEVSVSPTFRSKAINVTQTKSYFSPKADLRHNTLYYWRVKYRYPGTLTYLYSDVFTFTTGNPPSIPVPVSPANHALITTTNPLFDWRDSTLPPGGAAFDYYQFQVALDPQFTAILYDHFLYGITNSWDDSIFLDYGTAYYWRVRAFSVDGHFSSWSSDYQRYTNIQQVRVAYLPVNLLLPADGAIADSLRPTFTWEANPGATTYQIQISKYSTFTWIVVNSILNGPPPNPPYDPPTSFTPAFNLAPGTLYYWRVRAGGPIGPGIWSATFSFTTP